jgi:cytochrome c biogenesis protein CcdA
MCKILGVAAIVFLLSLSSLPSSNSFYVIWSSNSFYVFLNNSCEPCKAQLRVVRELYPTATFVTYDIADTASLSYFFEIEKVIDVPFMPLPLFGMFSDGKLKLVAAGNLSRESWEKIVLNETSVVDIYVDNGNGEAVFEKNIGDDKKIARLEELFLREEVYPSADGSEASFLIIFPTALVDAFNPCMLGFFLVFMVLISYSGNSKTALRISLAFSGAVFITRFLMGVVLMQVFWISSGIKFLVAIIVLVFGVVKILQFFLGEGRQIPSGFADKINKRIERASNAKAGFVAGCVTAFLIASCNSPSYFLVLSLLSTGSNVVGGLASLLIYNLVVVTPLLAIMVCIYVFNLTTTTNLRRWVTAKRRYINLLMGLWLVVLSALVMFYQAQFLG